MRGRTQAWLRRCCSFAGPPVRREGVEARWRLSRWRAHCDGLLHFQLVHLVLVRQGSPWRLPLNLHPVAPALCPAERAVPRVRLREEARTAVGDTGLLDHLLKHVVRHAQQP